MAEQIPDMKVEKFSGNHLIKNIYLDNREVVKKYCEPREGRIRNILGYLTIFAMVKSENNETAIGIVHVDEKKRNSIAEAREMLKGIAPEINEMMSDESVERFMN